MLVRLYSPLTLPTGYGRAGRELALAMLSAGIDLEVRPLNSKPGLSADLATRYPELGQCLRSDETLAADPKVVIIHALPYHAPAMLEQLHLSRSHGPRTVCYTTIESWDLPTSILAGFHRFDCAWTPADIPHSFDERIEVLPASSDSWYRFLYIGAWNLRKNPLGLIRAFVHAFGPQDEVELRLHCPGADENAFYAAMAGTGIPRADQPQVKLSTHVMTEEDIKRLYERCNCFVTAARGEAWNLPAFDAMIYNRHVISPAKLGSDEYLSETSADLVAGILSPALVDVTTIQAIEGGRRFDATTAHGLDSKCLWVEPNLADLSMYMRTTFERRTRSIRIDYNPGQRYGRVAVGQLIRKSLEEL